MPPRPKHFCIVTAPNSRRWSNILCCFSNILNVQRRLNLRSNWSNLLRCSHEMRAPKGLSYCYADLADVSRCRSRASQDSSREALLWEKKVNLNLPGFTETSQLGRYPRDLQHFSVLSFLWADRKQKMRKRMRADQMRIADVASTSTWRTKCSLKGKLYRDGLGFLMLWNSLSFKIAAIFDLDEK